MKKPVNTLVLYLKKSGYQCVETKRGPYTLDYIKQDVEGEVPLGYPIHGDPHHYGISAEYTAYAVIPQFLVLRIIEMKNILLKFERMSPELKKFTIQHTKKCDDCRYCTQTDKSGKRKQIYITVSYEGEYKLCPLYPGFTFSFTKLDDLLVTNLIAFLDFMEGVIHG
jgi:hypothetical protein